MTDTRQSTLAREVLQSAVGQISVSGLAREVLLSQVTQTWASVLAREVLLSVPGVTGTLNATEPQDTAAFNGAVIPVGGMVLYATEAQDMAIMTGTVIDSSTVPPGAPLVPQGNVVAVGLPNSQDYPRLVYTAPRFEVVAIAEIIEPSVLEAVEGMLPALVPPYVTAAANAAVAALAVPLVGGTMSGPLMLSPAIPTAPTMAATKQYVDTMAATSVPEVPPVPAGATWNRQTGQWVQAVGGGTVTNIATGAGLTGGPITATGTIAMANMAANSLKGNNTAGVAAPTDIPAGTVLTMIGGAPLNSPNFTGSPTLPTGTTGITQAGGTSNTSIATTAFVAAAVANYLPLTGGTLAGPGNLTLRGGILSGAAGAIPGAGGIRLNQNTVAGPAAPSGTALHGIGADAQAVDVTLDGFGNIPGLIMRSTGGTANAPVGNPGGGVFLSVIQTQGYTGSAYAGGTQILSSSVEPGVYSASAQGSQIAFNTIPIGTTGYVASLRLQGNTATFSGNVTANGTYLYLNGATGTINGGGGPFVYGDAGVVGFHLGATNNSFLFQQAAGTTVATLTSAGQFNAYAGYQTKPGPASSPDGHVFNIAYPVPAHLWVDGSDLGSINVTPCDERLKTNYAAPSVDALAAINAIVLQQFDWLATELTPEHHEDIGFTAQQLQTAVPNAVYPKEDPEQMWSVQLTPIVAYLIGAVQQLSAKVDALTPA